MGSLVEKGDWTLTTVVVTFWLDAWKEKASIKEAERVNLGQ